MRDLPKVFALYSEIDASFESQRSDANVRGDINAVERIELKQVINDQAYFVICWGQLESEIDDKCRDVIRSERSGHDWATRRVWERFDPDDKRLSGLSFEDRTALLLDKNGGPGSPWAMVMTYYRARNEIAHGKLRSRSDDMTIVVQNFYLIQAALQK